MSSVPNYRVYGVEVHLRQLMQCMVDSPRDKEDGTGNIG
jgi:hypothetical protein